MTNDARTCLSIAGVHNENVLAGTTLVVKLEPHSALHTINHQYIPTTATTAAIRSRVPSHIFNSMHW